MLTIACSTLQGALIYQQDMTLSSCASEEKVKEMAEDFCAAAKGDPDIKVVDIKFDKEKLGPDGYLYHAILTCHVSKIDLDFMRINAKVFQQNFASSSAEDFQ